MIITEYLLSGIVKLTYLESIKQFLVCNLFIPVFFNFISVHVASISTSRTSSYLSTNIRIRCFGYLSFSRFGSLLLNSSSVIPTPVSLSKLVFSSSDIKKIPFSLMKYLKLSALRRI